MRARSTFIAVAVVSYAAVPKAQQVYRAQDSDFIDTYDEVIRDTASFRALWALSGGSTATGKGAKMPNINFSRKMVIVAAGPSTSPPDSVVIKPDAKAKGVYTVVHYRECKPSSTKVMPIDIIAVPADPGSVLFRDKVVKGEACPN
jgi:hypothetical protein